jgi:hypothetical protein
MPCKQRGFAFLRRRRGQLPRLVSVVRIGWEDETGRSVFICAAETISMGTSTSGAWHILHPALGRMGSLTHCYYTVSPSEWLLPLCLPLLLVVAFPCLLLRICSSDIRIDWMNSFFLSSSQKKEMKSGSHCLRRAVCNRRRKKKAQQFLSQWR